MIAKIISGGQQGCDLGALRAAKKLGIPTGGYAPMGYWTETGPNLELRHEFGLTDCGKDYTHRTKLNVIHSDATVIFGVKSAGSYLTQGFARAENKPLLWLPVTELEREHSIGWLHKWLRLLGSRVSVLNVAGNRESITPGIGRWVEEFLVEVLPEWRNELSLSR